MEEKNYVQGIHCQYLNGAALNRWGIIKMEKKRKKKRLSVINLGTLVFLVIIIYLTAYVIQYLGKETLAIYEVSASDVSEEMSKTGLILRQEALVNTEEKGYVNYYVKDGSRVKKDGVVYTLDTTGKLQSYLDKLLERKPLSAMRRSRKCMRIC